MAKREEFGSCKKCGKTFLKNNPEHAFCSSECYDEYHAYESQGYHKRSIKKPKYLTGHQKQTEDINRIADAAGTSYGKYVASKRKG